MDNVVAAWSFLTLNASDTQFAGNEGYDDRIESYYGWDSTVPSHARVRAGDTVVLRDSSCFFGMGRIADVTTRTGNKDRFRCPDCRHTGFKARTTISPRYRCYACKAVFDVPQTDRLRDVLFYKAEYGKTWRAFAPTLRISELDSAYVNRSSQHAIRELDTAVLRTLLASVEEV